MAVHLFYEQSSLEGMTRPLQEMLHQFTVWVAIFKCTQQLDQIDLTYCARLNNEPGNCGYAGSSLI